MADHVRAAAVLRILYSALALMVGAIGLLFFGGLAAVTGVMEVSSSGSSSFEAPAILGLFAVIALTLGVLSSLPGLIVGWGMFRFRPWSRYLGIALSFFDLFAFPIGTAIGVYSLWVLFHRETAEIFEYGGPLRI